MELEKFKRQNSLTKFLLVATFILLVVGIPVSTTYWWPQFWGPQFPREYWEQWVQWLLIAATVLGALWVLRLIIWIKGKREEREFHSAMSRGMNVSPPINAPPHLTSSPEGKHWWVPPDGPPSDIPPPNTSEPIGTYEFIDPSEFITSQSPFESAQDSFFKDKYHKGESSKGVSDSAKGDKMTEHWKSEMVSQMKRQVNGFVSEGKIPPSEGRKLHERIDNTKDNPHFIDDTMHLLWSIRRRPSK